MSIIDCIKEAAAKNPRRIIFSEPEDERVYAAMEIIVKKGIARPILIGSSQVIEKSHGSHSLEGITLVDPYTNPKTEEYEDLFVEIRKHKGLSHEDARRLMFGNFTYYGCMMIKAGDADGLVGGICHSSSDTIRPMLQIIGPKPGTLLASTIILIEVPDCPYGSNGLFAFSDGVLEQNPTSEKLASIAISAGDCFGALTGYEPKIALLSHSTKGSAKHEHVDKVVKATQLAKEQRPDLLIDGELQFDAAIVPEIGAMKAPDSKVAGQANVLIFPDVDAGNICYKLAERLAGAKAYGSITTGMMAPVNDMSRGCSVDDIVGIAAITVMQANSNYYK